MFYSRREALFKKCFMKGLGEWLAGRCQHDAGVQDARLRVITIAADESGR
jgi:hypothetical protein